jgi:hypothetical protein
MSETNLESSMNPAARRYDLRSLSIVAAAFAVTLFLLESEGLVGWASRMDVGPAQTRWLEVLQPVETGLDAIKLTTPRRALIAAADRAGRAMQFFGDTTGSRTGDRVNMDTLNTEPPQQLAQAPIAQPAVATAGTAKSEWNVVLVGDSMMAVGLAPNFIRELEKDNRFKVIRAHKSATGLSRPEIYSWPDAFRGVTAKVKPDFIVCAIGGNDAQNVKYENKVLKFGTREWDDLYMKRVVEMAKLFESTGARTLWVGLPVMRAKSFNDKIQHVNALVRQAIGPYKTVTYIESTPAVTGRDHAFASQLPDEKGRMVKMRAEDGIHLSDAGGKAVSMLAVKWLLSMNLK